MKFLRKTVFFLIFLIIVPIFFTGCTSCSTSIYVKEYPKLVYEIGDTFSYKGLKLETLNADGTLTNININAENIEVPDLTTSGEKKVKISKNDLSTTFNVYVADYVVTSKSNLKTIIENANNGDIIYIKEGIYKPENINDDSLYNIVINKKLVFVGDGKDKTIIHGNFLVGAEKIMDNYIGLMEFEDVKFLNLGFQLDSTIKDRYISFEGPYGNYDVYGAIKTFDSKKVLVSDCSFKGYSYGLNCDTVEDLTVLKSTFKDIKINGIKVTNDIKNSSFFKNAFMDIGENSLTQENAKQGNVGAMFLSFNKSGNAGVIVSNNTFARIALKTGKLTYTNNGADELELDSATKLSSGSYVNNSSIIHLVSSSENNLNVGGIIFSMNNFGQAYKNISFGTTKNNMINQAGVYINEN